MTAITVGTVTHGSNADLAFGPCSAALGAGVPVYESGTDLLAADADAATTARAKGITVVSSAAGSSTLIIKGGDIIFTGDPLTKGTEYYVGTTAGTIVPKADLGSGDYVTRLGIASDANTLRVDIDATGITI